MQAVKLNRGWMHAVALLGSVVTSFSGSWVNAQSIGLYELARFNISSVSGTTSSSYIGSNPTAVAWNGSKLFVAGYNASGVTGTAAIVEILNANGVLNGTLSGFVTPSFSAAFGSGTFANTRGYTGLASNGSTVLATLDNGVNMTTGLQGFSTANNTKLWDLSNSGTTSSNIGTARVGGGPDFDPGFGGGGSGAGWMISGQGRRFLNNESTGAAIYTTTSNSPPGATQGMIVNGGTTGWRDLAFNPANGDVYTRNNNLLLLNVRTGSNSVQSSLNLGGLTALGATIGQNLGYMNSIASGTFNAFSNTYAGDLVVLNDRSSTLAGQSFTNVIKFFTTGTAGGSLVTPTWTFINNSTPSTSTALYDFEWDSASQTLAVMDFTNRNVSIFSTAVPEPSTWVMLVSGVLGGGAMVRRRLLRRS